MSVHVLLAGMPVKRCLHMDVLSALLRRKHFTERKDTFGSQRRGSQEGVRRLTPSWCRRHRDKISTHTQYLAFKYNTCLARKCNL